MENNMATKLISKIIEKGGTITDGVYLTAREEIISDQKSWPDEDKAKDYDFSTEPYWITTDTDEVPVGVYTDDELRDYPVILASEFIGEDLEFWTEDMSINDAVTNVIELSDGTDKKIIDKESIKSWLLGNAYYLYDNNEPGLLSNHLVDLVKAEQIEQYDADEYAAEHINTSAMSM